MKMFRWSLSIVPLMTLCGAANAQNSVTLYGLIDQGVNFTNNAGSGSAVQLRSGDTSGSRWGVKGNEDLGSGLSAIFHLEGGFNASNGQLGQNGRLFGRQAYVGLQSNQYGTLTLGRQYDPTVDLFSSITAAGNWGGDVGAVPFDNDNADWDFRVNNSIKYATPVYRGFSGEAMYGFSNTAGGFQDNRVISAAGQYQGGGLTAELAYMHIDHPGSGTSGAVTDDATFSGSSQENIDAGLAYKFSKVQIAAAYSHTKIDDPTNNAFLSGDQNPSNGGTWTGWRFDNFQLNGEYFFRPDFWFAASYTYTLGDLSSTEANFDPRWHTVALMLDYDFSARTSVYVQGTWQHVESAHTGTQFDNAQSLLAPGASSSPNQLVYRVAMIHRF
ncbi:porin [Paraburkholderia rhizosphaerae]|uniref:Putative porin n=1 Tax=Paraburkholderia rhizosphaerae TaxID=480658 RepID=A0A4R8LVE9_9BURK|nr:porin [Paraburkholderia rhizosphaerae]TDY51790.1 putative porin [Paraburkholderia rhizosphaerae]